MRKPRQPAADRRRALQPHELAAVRGGDNGVIQMHTNDNGVIQIK